MTVVAEAEPWPRVVLDVAEQAGLAVVVPEGGSDDGLVSLTLVETSAYSALRTLANLRQLEPIMEGGVVTFKPTSVEAVAVLPPGFLPTEEAVRVIEAVSDKRATVKSLGQSLVIAGDATSVARAGEVAGFFEDAQPGQWLISVWLLQVNADFQQRLGVEMNLSGSLAALAGPGAEVLATMLLTSTLEWHENQRLAKVMNHGTLSLVEGQASRLQSGETVPIPKRTVSPEGTVTISGYEFIDTGLTIDVSGRPVPGGVQLAVSPSVGQITGFVEEAPIVARRALSVNCMVASGDWVVLAGLDDWREVDSRAGIFGLQSTLERGTTSVVVVLRAVDVGRRGQLVEGMTDDPDGD